MYAAMEITPPFLFALSYLGIKKGVCYVPPELLSYFHGRRPIAKDRLLLPPYETDEVEPEPNTILKHFSDILANAGGLASSVYFDQNAKMLRGLR